MAESLVPLPPVARLSPRVIRILGHNPGKFTLQGTNTYLVSAPEDADAAGEESTPAVLLDAAEGVEEHLEALKEVLTGRHAAAGGRRRHVTDIVLTHWHHDHTAGLPQLLTMLHGLPRPQAPRIHKFPNPEEDDGIIAALADVPRGAYTPHAPSGLALHPLLDNALLVPGTGKDAAATLRALHTPGHTTDHLSFLLLEERTLFSGDNVLGQGTSVFEDLGAYMASLERSLREMEGIGGAEVEGEGEGEGQGEGEENTIFPAHGPVLPRGRAAVKTYRAHRLEREAQVLDQLGTSPPAVDPSAADSDSAPSASASPSPSEPQQWTIMQLTQSLYASYPPSLYPAAARGLFLHLHKLASEGRVQCVGAEVPPVKPLKAEYMELGWRLAGGAAVGTGTGTPPGTGKL